MVCVDVPLFFALMIGVEFYAGMFILLIVDHRPPTDAPRVIQRTKITRDVILVGTFEDKNSRSGRSNQAFNASNHWHCIGAGLISTYQPTDIEQTFCPIANSAATNGERATDAPVASHALEGGSISSAGNATVNSIRKMN
eukprot:scaffold22325_cov99-Skeletonema_dohrnii-CCMP3373.AAC.3